MWTEGHPFLFIRSLKYLAGLVVEFFPLEHSFPLMRFFSFVAIVGYCVPTGNGWQRHEWHMCDDRSVNTKGAIRQECECQTNSKTAPVKVSIFWLAFGPLSKFICTFVFHSVCHSVVWHSRSCCSLLSHRTVGIRNSCTCHRTFKVLCRSHLCRSGLFLLTFTALYIVHSRHKNHFEE